MNNRRVVSLVPLSLLLSFLVISTVLAMPQTEATPHNHPGLAPTEQIDGSVHPELIPDSTAYRLFFIVVGNEPNSPDGAKAHQRAHLAGLKLQTNDSEALVKILSEFRMKYADLIQQYNKTAEVAGTKGNAPDSTLFLSQRDFLVEDTRANIRTFLTPEGVATLDAHIQAEKRGIKVFGAALPH